MGSQNSDAAENWWLLETQLIQPQMNPEMVSPWEKEWSSEASGGEFGEAPSSQLWKTLRERKKG